MDQTTLKSLVEYNPETGVMSWKERTLDQIPDESVRKSWNSRLSGQPLRTVDGKGYLHFSYRKKFYRVHRMAWLFEHGSLPGIIDHINGDRTDNRLSNLREVTPQQNNMNQRRNRKNTSGHPGVYWNKRSRLWCAQMKFNGETYHLGSSKDINEAVALRKNEERRLGFGPRHGGF